MVHKIKILNFHSPSEEYSTDMLNSVNKKE
jgi:hypothetical protein